MTPAAELRTAATKLRTAAKVPLEAIEPAAPGEPDEWTAYYSSAPEVLEGDRPWVVLMSPLLAGPLAEWLEAIADQEEALRGPENADIAAFGLHPFGYGSALAVAHVINGTTEAS